VAVDVVGELNTNTSVHGREFHLSSLFLFCYLQVPGDPLGLVRLFSSPERFCERLHMFMLRGSLHPRFFIPYFLAANAPCWIRVRGSVGHCLTLRSNVLPDIGYWAGNEPDILAPWLFVFGGCPHYTQYWTRWLVDHKYNTSPDGIPGNDDYGTMSAWLVFASLGFYPLSGAPFYILGSPSLQVLAECSR
jgi:putative alpha-1,2-mannosidase